MWSLAKLKGENDFMIKWPFNKCLSLYFKSDFNLSHWSQSGSYSNKKGLGKTKRDHCSLSQEIILREEHEKFQRVNLCKNFQNSGRGEGHRFRGVCTSWLAWFPRWLYNFNCSRPYNIKWCPYNPYNIDFKAVVQHIFEARWHEFQGVRTTQKSWKYNINRGLYNRQKHA